MLVSPIATDWSDTPRSMGVGQVGDAAEAEIERRARARVVRARRTPVAVAVLSVARERAAALHVLYLVPALSRSQVQPSSLHH